MAPPEGEHDSRGTGRSGFDERQSLATAQRVGYSEAMREAPVAADSSGPSLGRRTASDRVWKRTAGFGLAVLGLLLFRANWMGWEDPLIDFGRELYVAWQLSEGQTLYRDIAYLDGPFSPYWNALCFRLLPTSLRTLEFANLAIVALTSGAIFGLLRRFSDGAPGLIAGTMGGVIYLGVFAFNSIGTGANMNWVAPYSHGITHGVALSLLSLWLSGRHLEQGRVLHLVLAGLATGFAVLTKPEIAAASLASLGVGCALGLRPASAQSRPPEGLPAAPLVVLLLAMIALPVLAASASLATAMPVEDAIAGALGGWTHLLNSSVQDLHFYRWVMGVDDIPANLGAMFLSLVPWAAALLPAFAATRWARGRSRRTSEGLAIALPLALLLLAALGIPSVRGADAFRWLPLFLLPYAGILGWQAFTRPRPADRGRAAGELALAIFALVLLAKIILKPVLVGYAFALALPGALVAVLVLLVRVPEQLEAAGADPRIFRRCAALWLCVVAWSCTAHSEFIRESKTVTIGRGDDAFRADPAWRAQLARELVSFVDTRLPRDAKLLVMPEGVMVNYQTRRPNPTRHLNFLPPELAIFGESQILSDLRSSPPDYVALVHRETPEYGLPLFGRDYGESLLAWVRANYQRVAQVGAAPLEPARLRDRREGFEILRRRSPPN